MAYFIDLLQRLNELMPVNLLEKHLTHNRPMIYVSYYHNHDVGAGFVYHLQNCGQCCVFQRVTAPGYGEPKEC